MLCVIELNSSTADAVQDDPTLRKVIGFAIELGFGGALMLNVGAYRATDPQATSTLSNSQCSVDLSATTVTASGSSNRLTFRRLPFCDTRHSANLMRRT
jgi:uncharacterized protein DUF1643